MKWIYSVTTNTIWTSFDYGTVEADTRDEAIKLAKEELQYNFNKVNEVLASADVTQGMTIEFNESEIQIAKA